VRPLFLLMFHVRAGFIFVEPLLARIFNWELKVFFLSVGRAHPTMIQAFYFSFLIFNLQPNYKTCDA
jgi:hypothetical protein